MRKSKRHRIIILHIFIVLLGFIMLYPVLWMVIRAFTPNAVIFSDASLWPGVFTLENFISGWRGFAGVQFGRFFANSLFISGVSVLANIISCSMAAYAFARLKFFGRTFCFAAMMLTLMLPGHVTFIPRFAMFNAFNWINTYLPIIVPRMLATDAFFIFLMVQFIRSLPKDLDEAATIDGCSKFGIFLRIIIPLSKPALVTTALFTFLWSWDDFFNQLIYISSPALFTVPLGLRSFVDATGQANWGAVLAMSTLSIVPIFVLFLTLQKYFVQGIATTGVKG